MNWTVKKAVCECGSLATTVHAGDRVCMPCREAVTAAQASSDHYIKVRRSDASGSNNSKRRHSAEADQKYSHVYAVGYAHA